MSQRRFFGLLRYAAILVFGAGLLIWVFSSGEPRCGGRTLSQWIDQGRKGDESATNAVGQIGTNAIPCLLDWALARDSDREEYFRNWIQSHLHLRLSTRSAGERHFLARAGFRMLGDKAQAAWPTLIQWTRDDDPLRRMLGVDYLAEAGADKDTFPPVLKRLIHDPDEDVQRFAVDQFKLHFPEEAYNAGVNNSFSALKWLQESQNSYTNLPTNGTHYGFFNAPASAAATNQTGAVK